MNKKLLTLAAVLLAAAASLNAQNAQEALFLKDYRLGYRYNPALMSEGDFLSSGQLATSLRNNVGASAFIYPGVDGKVVTFLHPSVKAADVTAALKDDNYLTGALNYNLFAYGIRRGEAMHTFESNVRVLYGLNLPGELFKILKLGTPDGQYDISNLRTDGNVCVEFAYGYARRLSDVVSVGARIKLLAGMYNAGYNIRRLDLTVSEEAVKTSFEADLDLTDRALEFAAGDDGYLGFENLVFHGLPNWPSGGGLAADLGIVVTPTENLMFSASLLDLGGMLWYLGNRSTASGTAEFTGLNELAVEDFNKDGVMAQLNGVKSEFLSQMRLSPVKNKMRLNALPFSAHAGLKYTLPWRGALSLGADGTYGYQCGMSFWETRGNLSCSPAEWLNLTANAGYGTYGPVWGAAANIRIYRFHVTAGLQNGFGGFIPETSMPLKANFKTKTIGLTYDL